jgi:hypothetical protein
MGVETPPPYNWTTTEGASAPKVTGAEAGSGGRKKEARPTSV